MDSLCIHIFGSHVGVCKLKMVNSLWWLSFIVLGYCPRMLLSDRSHVTTHGVPGDIQNVCPWRTFNASCPLGSVIEMTHALYGRMHPDVCFKDAIGHRGCQEDVITQAHRMCSGRQSCRIDVPSHQLEQTEPCYSLQNYLEASYKCTPVEYIAEVCNSCDFIKVSGPSGYISNVVTNQTGCGSQECPWRITVSRGQRIKFTLSDYTPLSSVSVSPTGCKVFATLRDGNSSVIDKFCGPAASRRIFSSRSNLVDLRILRQPGSSVHHYFLIKYEAVGCAHNIIPPSGATITYINDKATVRCSGSDETWVMTCEGTEWRGHKNCTEYSTTPSKVEAKLPFGMSVAIIIGVAFIICALVVTIGLGCYKIRRHERSRPRQRPQPTPEDLYQRSLRRDEEIHMTFNPPILNECKQFGCNCTLDRQKGIYDPRSDYTHIWEAPLPNEPPKKLTST